MKHGHTSGIRSATWVSWKACKDRCFLKTASNYKYYGGRGVTMCSRWANDFKEFLKDMGERPINKTLDRIDPNGDYEPANCRWSDIYTQNSNKTNNHKLRFNGEEKTLTEWGRDLGFRKNTLSERLRTGWDIERALTTPTGPSGPSKFKT